MYTYRTVSNALTYLQHSATSPRASIFPLTKHGVCCNFFGTINIVEAQRHSRCAQQSGVAYSLSRREGVVCCRQTGQSVATCVAVITTETVCTV